MKRDLHGIGRRRSEKILVIFATVLVLAVIAALFTTIRSVDTKQASDAVAPGTTGLARPHPPLDRGPGEPVK